VQPRLGDVKQSTTAKQQNNKTKQNKTSQEQMSASSKWEIRVRSGVSLLFLTKSKKSIEKKTCIKPGPVHCMQI
jgi:hypothetical protein